MIKIPTLFKKDPKNLALVTPEIDPKNQWVLDGEGVATRKYDGTAAAIIDGQLYKRYDVKKGRQVPNGAIPCQDPDPVTGHWPHWVRVSFPENPEDKYFNEAYLSLLADPTDGWIRKPDLSFDGTYELCGPKVQGNPEKLEKHELIKHGAYHLFPERTYEGLRDYLESNDIEGIVFHHPDGRMCKIRKSDYGIKRNK